MLRAIDHVQIAIPPGGEERARPFYGDLLGLTEVPKPEPLAARGCWFEAGAIKVHLGVEQDFRANTKAHVAFLVDDVAAIADRAVAAGYPIKPDDELGDVERVFIYDPFGNRLEFLTPKRATSSPFPLEGGRVGDGGGRISAPKASSAGTHHQASYIDPTPPPSDLPSQATFPLQGEGFTAPRRPPASS